MAKFCGGCGSPVTETEKFCGKCGQPQEVAAPVVATATVAAPTATAAPVPPVEKKPMSKQMKIGLIAVAAIVVILFVVSKVLTSINSQEAVVEKFMTAIEEGDVAALAKVTISSDTKVDVTEENLAPFLLLCEENRTYKETVEEALLVDIKDAIGENSYTPWIEEVDGFLHTGYRIVLPCDDYEIASNVPEPELSINGEALGLWETGKMTADDKFPGIYTITGTYEGLSLEQEITLTGGTAYVEFEYREVWVSNENNYPVDIYADGTFVTTLEAWDYTYLEYQPMDVAVTAELEVGDTVLSVDWDNEDNYYDFYVYFDLISAELYNSNDFVVEVWLNGDFMAEIMPYDAWYYDTILVGDMIECIPDSPYFEGYTIECTGDDSYIYSYLEYELADEEGACDAAWQYVVDLFSTYYNWDMDSLMAYYQGRITDDLMYYLEYAMESGEFPVTWDYANPEDLEFYTYYYGEDDIEVDLYFDLPYVDEDGDERTNYFYDYLPMYLSNGAWVVGEP